MAKSKRAPVPSRKSEAQKAEAATSAKPEPQIYVPTIRRDRVKLKLKGDAPLIVHAWSSKAKRQMLEKQMTGSKAKKSLKSPEDDYKESMYIMPDGKTPGFPCVGFKAAAVAACRFIEGLPMTEARGAFHVVGELAAIVGTPRMREDMVRVGMGTADIRYRAEFPEWSTELEIEYNPLVIGPAQIANLLNLAGFHVGVGEMRPGKTGFGYGRFHVA